MEEAYLPQNVVEPSENIPVAASAPEGTEAEADDQAPQRQVRTLCEVCQQHTAKYRCPGCDTRSCSLACTKQHKSGSGCSGKRSRTGPVQLSSYGKRQLVSDYCFLEEAVLAAESAGRARLRLQDSGAEACGSLKFLLHQTQQRNMRWGILPPAAERRLANTTCVDRQKRRIMWRVQWRFAAADYTATDERLDEATKLADAVAAHLRLQSGQAATQQRLRDYLDAGVAQLILLLRIEHRPANAPAYHRLMPNHTLRLALAQKTVIEFPVITIVLPRELPSYTVLKPGEF